jgi:hypothetical protein
MTDVCQACERAEADPRTGHYTAGCLECQARALAQSPEAHRRAADPDALRAAMFRVWPEEATYRRGRASVWAWINRLEGRA